MENLFNIQFIDVIDIFLVALLLYQAYKLIKGTNAFSIVLGVFAFYLLWIVVRMLHMELLSVIMGQFIGVGVISLVVVFQQEIRRFLLYIGSRYINNDLHSSLLSASQAEYIDEVLSACQSMSQSRTGALIIFARKSNLYQIEQTGDLIDAKISQRLIENIFYKNSPLHDGAMIIVGSRIHSARCVLPTSERTDIPAQYGLRHRAAIGLSEQSDAIALIVSEQTGQISYVKDGVLYSDQTIISLKEKLIK